MGDGEKNGTSGEGDVPPKKRRTPRFDLGKRWHRFHVLTPNSAILRGSYAMNHPHFKYRSRGRQAAPSSVVAIVYGVLFEPKDWIKEYVDQILEYGDKVFRTSMIRNHVKDNEYMKAKSIHPEFYISNYRVLVCVEETGIYGNLFSETVGCPDFTDGLQKFFDGSDGGVITAQGTSIAIWRHPEVGFMYFNPAPCGEDGVNHPEGTACVMRFKCLNNICDHVLNTMDKRYDSRYCIDKVTVLRVNEVARGYLDRAPSSTRLNVDKSVLRTINPVDIDENKMDCTKPAPKGDKAKVVLTARIQKEPLAITISNYSIDKRFATDPLVDQNKFDTGYTYDDMHVNVPSTFRELLGQMAILHGLTHEHSEMYKGKGAQNVANCVLAIAMKKVHLVKTWLRPKLDEILTLGDDVFAEVKTAKPMVKNMTASDLNDLKIQVENKKLVIDVDLITVTGTISSKIPTVLNLKQALEEFFLVNTEGVIESSSMSVAIWSQDDMFYMFDPRQCDKLGVRIRDEKGGKGKGKDEGAEKKKGNCCVIRFPNTDALATLFWKNVDSAKRNDRFTIRHITILDDVPGTRPWHDFQPGTAGETWILRGTTSNDDEDFEDESRGVQGLAMPVVALISARETPPSKWTSEIVDTAVREGDAYYNWCVPAVETEEEGERRLFVTNLKKNLYFKNRKVRIEVEDGTVVGDLTSPDGSDVPNLNDAMKQFFEDHQYGIADVKNTSVAVWKVEEDAREKDEIVKQNVYYMFDPNPRNKQGLWAVDETDEEENAACVARTFDLPVLARMIETNAGQDEELGNEFAIYDMKVVSIGNEMSEEEIEADKQIPVKPDMYNYISMGENGALLLGSFNQGNDVAFKRQTRDKQQAGSALAALAMTKLYNPHLWYREVVDDILKLGDKITAENLENIAEEQAEEEATRAYLLPSEINEDFSVGVNRMTVGLEEETVTARATDLPTQLETFFGANTMGIIRQGNVIMPIWKETDVYFLMDPRGRDSRGEPREKDGAAAVMWFTDIPSLTAAIQSAAAGEEFVVDLVTLDNAYETRVAEEERPVKPSSGENPWFHFPKMDEGVWGIDGTVTMNDERFKEDNRSNQTAAIAVMAIVFAKVYEPRYWTQAVLDEVIITGDKLHSKCVDRLGEGSIPRINEIMTEFFLSTRRINLTIKDCVEAGSLTAKPPKVQDLATGIQKFFARYTSGALSFGSNRNVAIWRFGDEYYTLIPDWGEEDSAKPKVLRFDRMEALIEHLQNFLGKEGDYEMIAIDVLNWNKLPPWKFDPSSAVRPSNLPPLNAYRRVRGEARAILRGGYHQGDEIFPEMIRNKQGAANCVVALGMSVVKNPVTWTKKTMDEILAIGTNVHRETQKAKPTIRRIKPKDIIRVFYVGINILTADIEAGTVSGIVAIPPPEPEDKKKKKKKRGATRRAKAGRGKKSRSTRIRAPPPPPILLEQGVRQFFEKNRAGILVTDRGSVALWKDMGVYFMYDPRALSDQGLPDFYGTSCVMWFACVEPLYEVLFANIEEQEKYGRYDLCRVIIKTAMIEPLPCPAGFRPYFDCTTAAIPVTPAKMNTTLDVETVTDYVMVDEELSVLRGSLHMNHRIWSTESRGLQSTAIAAVAIVVGLLHVPSTWTPELIDAILRYGDLLHSDSVRAARPGNRNLSPSELLTVFIVGDFRATIHVHNHTTAGILHTFDLSESLVMFFRSNCVGILHTTNIAVAVMQHYGKFYLFDPCARNDQGRPSFDGAACVIKCESIMKMAKVFVTNCNLKTPHVYTLNAVNVLDLNFFSDAKSGCPPKCIQ